MHIQGESKVRVVKECNPVENDLTVRFLQIVVNRRNDIAHRSNFLLGRQAIASVAQKEIKEAPTVTVHRLLGRSEGSGDLEHQLIT